MHDHIKEFEDTIRGELKEHSINVLFADSKEEVLLQLADNAVSVLRHAYDKSILHFKCKEQWKPQCEWDMKLMTRSMRKFSVKHISFTVPLSEWAASLCTEIMFNPRYPKKYRNNLHFNYYYQENLKRAFSSIVSFNCQVDEIVGLLER